MLLSRTGDAAADRLEPAERPSPVPGDGEIAIRVEACGICRTDLHIVEGDNFRAGRRVDVISRA